MRADIGIRCGGQFYIRMLAETNTEFTLLAHVAPLLGLVQSSDDRAMLLIQAAGATVEPSDHRVPYLEEQLVAMRHTRNDLAGWLHDLLGWMEYALENWAPAGSDKAEKARARVDRARTALKAAKV